MTKYTVTQVYIHDSITYARVGETVYRWTEPGARSLEMAWARIKHRPHIAVSKTEDGLEPFAIPANYLKKVK